MQSVGYDANGCRVFTNIGVSEAKILTAEDGSGAKPVNFRTK
jgi:hypothetical protein